jgi:hypothetical protein
MAYIIASFHVHVQDTRQVNIYSLQEPKHVLFFVCLLVFGVPIVVIIVNIMDIGILVGTSVYYNMCVFIYVHLFTVCVL